MIFRVAYSDKARLDLRNIYEYIAKKLLVPEIAVGQINRIMKAIRELNEMPQRHRIYEDERWHSQGIHFFSVDNYLVFYLIDETQGNVTIVRIMYGGRDINKQLS